MVFDLKGSSISRMVNFNLKKLARKQLKNIPILKDTNFLQLQEFQNIDLIKLDNQKKKEVFQDLKKDSEFLCK